MSKLNQNLNTVPMVLKQKNVEGRLWETLRSLAVTEGNIVLLNTLKSKNLATNDVKNFVDKQKIHKRVNKTADARVRRSAMHSKLADALAHAKRLRQTKNVLKQKFVKQCASKSQGSRIIKNLMVRYRQTNQVEIEAAKKKVKFLHEKDVMEKVTEHIPGASRTLLEGVNIFSDSGSVKAEPPTGLKVFDPSLQFSKDELSLLPRVPSS